MTFTEAEEKFHQLQSRVQRGEHLSEEEYESELAKLMVQDQQGTFWSPDPESGRWLYFNGTDWVPGSPPREEMVAQIQPKPAATTSAEVKPEPAPTIPETAPEHAAPQSEATAAPTTPPPSYEPESIPVVPTSADPVMPDVRTGLPLRPTRKDLFPAAVPGERPWLPFALGAVVLALCALVLFFGVGPFVANFTQPSAQPTRTVVAVIEPTNVPASPTSARTNTPPPPTSIPTSSVVTGKVNADPLNVRAGPGSTFAILGKLAQGDQVVLTGKSADGTFFQIQYPEPGKFGWVAKQFIDLTSGSVDALPVVTPAAAPAPTSAPKPTLAKPTETPAG